MEQLIEIKEQLNIILTNIKKTINRPYTVDTRTEKRKETKHLYERAKQIYSDLQKLNLDSREVGPINVVVNSITEKSKEIFRLIQNWDNNDNFEINTEQEKQSTSSNVSQSQTPIQSTPIGVSQSQLQLGTTSETEPLHSDELITSQTNLNLLPQSNVVLESLSSGETDPKEKILDSSSNISTTLKTNLQNNSGTSNKTPISRNTNFHESTNNNKQKSKMNAAEYLKICSNQINKPYAGDPLGLQSFIDSIKLLDSLVTEANLKQLLLTFIKTRIEGRAREFITDEHNTINLIIDTLKNNIKPDSSKVIEGRMLSLRASSTNADDFSKKAEDLSDALRRSLIIEGISHNKATEMTIEKTVELCRKNTNSDLVKSVLESTKFDSPKEVIAKLLVQTEKTKQEQQILSYQTIKKENNNKRSGNNFNRGNRGRGNFNNRRGRGGYKRFNNFNDNFNNNRGGFRGNRGNFYRNNRNFNNNNQNIRSFGPENYLDPQMFLGENQSGNQNDNQPQNTRNHNNQ